MSWSEATNLAVAIRSESGYSLIIEGVHLDVDGFFCRMKEQREDRLEVFYDFSSPGDWEWARARRATRGYLVEVMA